jgi:peptide/nickel transport system permease protein
VVALMLIVLFTNTLGWLPSIGLRDVHLRNPTFLQSFVDRTRHLIMPVLASSLNGIASTMRYQRGSFLDVIKQDYIRTARSKGLNERTVSIRHALRNASLPIVTNLGMSLPGLISGSMIIENIFGLPGMGRLFMTAMIARDYPVVMGVTIITSLLILISIFLVDIAYAIIDPRIRFS